MLLHNGAPLARCSRVRFRETCVARCQKVRRTSGFSRSAVGWANWAALARLLCCCFSRSQSLSAFGSLCSDLICAPTMLHNTPTLLPQILINYFNESFELTETRMQWEIGFGVFRIKSEPRTPTSAEIRDSLAKWVGMTTVLF